MKKSLEHTKSQTKHQTKKLHETDQNDPNNCNQLYEQLIRKEDKPDSNICYDFLTQLDSTNDYIPRDLDSYCCQICQRTDVSNIYFLKSFSSSISKLFDLPVLDCRLDLIHHPQHLPESLVVLTKSYRENHPVTSQEWFSTCSEEFALRSNCRFLLQVTALRYAHLNTDIKIKHTFKPNYFELPLVFISSFHNT